MFITSQPKLTELYNTNNRAAAGVQLSAAERQVNADNDKNAAKLESNNAETSPSSISFLANAMEELLANKMGMNKEKMDKLKEEIETLRNLDNPTEQQQKRLNKLTEQLGEMAREAAERAAEQQAKDTPGNDKLEIYKQVAMLTQSDEGK